MFDTYQDFNKNRHQLKDLIFCSLNRYEIFQAITKGKGGGLLKMKFAL